MRTRQPLIFVVHDDNRIMAAIRQLADLFGWRMRGFCSAPLCLAALAREQPDGLLTELNLQGMNGVQLLQAMDAMDLAIPVIAMSDERAPPLSDQAIDAGALAVLHAPFWDEDLGYAIKTAIDTRGIFTEALVQSAKVHAG